MSEDRSRFLFRSTYLAIFGRFAPGRQAEPPADEVLVGREGERSYLIDLLISTGKQGAYLVTGRRGAGKTSFVDRCVDEYEQSVFKRFLRADVGRGPWDRLALMAVIAATLFAVFVLADLNSMLVRVANPATQQGADPNSHSLLLWLLAAPLTVLLLWPAVYALELAQLFLWDPRPTDQDTRLTQRLRMYGMQRGGLIPLILVGSGSVYVWTQHQMAGSYAYLVFIVSLTLLYLLAPFWAVIQSFLAVVVDSVAGEASADDSGTGGESSQDEGEDQPGKPASDPDPALEEPIKAPAPVSAQISERQNDTNPSEADSQKRPAPESSEGGDEPPERFGDWCFSKLESARRYINSQLPLIVSTVAALVVAVLAVTAATGIIGVLFEQKEQPQYLAFAVLFGLAAATFLRFLDLATRLDRTKVERDNDSVKTLAKAMESGGVRYLVASAILLFFSMVVARHADLTQGKRSLLVLTAVLVIAAAAGIAYRLFQLDPPDTNFQPPTRSLLLIKAALCIVLASHLALPSLAGICQLGSSAWHEILDSQTPDMHSSQKSECDKTGPKTNTTLLQTFGCMKDKGAEITSLFSSPAETLRMMAGVLAVLLLIYYLEYEWIVRPQISGREDRLTDPAERPVHEDGLELTKSFSKSKSFSKEALRIPREYYRALAESTLPWAVYRTWLPVLVVRVNLGFDKLDHRRVIHAMLVGLRDSYNRIFLAWNSSLGNIRRLLVAILALSLTTMIDDTWFQLPSNDTPDGAVSTSKCEALERALGQDEAVGAWALGCAIGGDVLLDFLYFDLVERIPWASEFERDSKPPSPPSIGTQENEKAGVQEREHFLLRLILPYQEEPVKVKFKVNEEAGVSTRTIRSEGVVFSVYHALIFLLVLLVIKRLAFSIPLIPYRLNLQRIDDVLDSLSATRRKTNQRFTWQPAAWLYGFFGDPQELQTETAPLDPRTVELAFLGILSEIQHGGLRMPGIVGRHLSFPTPEITFIFDELDKLGSRPDPRIGEIQGSEQVASLHAEQVRSVALRSLLSDLKNLLSSAEARFIFVGGRNLYDEWLADQTARQPLLTNIFNAVVYLPSLLADYGGRGSRDGLERRVREYLYLQDRRASLLFYYWVGKRWAPGLGLGLRRRLEDCFVQDLNLNDLCSKFSLTLINLTTGKSLDHDPEHPGHDLRHSKKFTDDFVRFLTYRSMGNPKKLKELLASFVRPAGRALARADEGRGVSVSRLRTEWPCRHVLHFGEHEIFRIQLLNDIYRHVLQGLEQRLQRQDDKLVISVLFLVDFLFKFHRRAFSWSNLERVDELIHIHRAPDLRAVLERVVQHSSERYLHRVLNGMYSYRFRGDVARELEYLSKQSPQEMAAFNFTLDESQSLKALFEAAIRAREDASPDLLSGLGELYEFDQEFETARHYYNRSIHTLDERLESSAAGEGKDISLKLQSDSSEGGISLGSVMAVALGEGTGRALSRLFITWGIRRLRMMLQVGMTYEQARNIEGAEARYQAGRTLARATLLAYLDDVGRERLSRIMSVSIPKKSLGQSEASEINLLKHMNILFQPAFARAWAVEKLVVAVDTSVSIIEEELWTLRQVLPFVRDKKPGKTKHASAAQGSSFSLIMSQLHNKAGDMYFLKGKSRFDPKNIEASYANDGKEADGYLLRSHYHYAVSLHELRRYMKHRLESAPLKFSIGKDDGLMFRSGQWPDFIYRAVGSGLSDIAESMLARVSFYALWKKDKEESESVSKVYKSTEKALGKLLKAEAPPGGLSSLFDGLLESVVNWVEGGQPAFEVLSAYGWEGSDGSSWFGKWIRCGLGWKSYGKLRKKRDLIEFGGRDISLRRLVLSLVLSRVGARLFAEGGYPEDSAKELMQIAETVETLLNWLDISNGLPELAGKAIERATSKTEASTGDLTVRPPTVSRARNRNVIGFLLVLAVDSVLEAERYLQSSVESPSAEAWSDYFGGWKLGERVPPRLLTVATSLDLRIRSYREELENSPAKSGEETDPKQGSSEESESLDPETVIEGLSGLSEKLTVLVRRWTGLGEEKMGTQAISESLLRHRYPMLNRLRAQYMLWMDTVLAKKNNEEMITAEEFAHAKMFLEDIELFNGPFYFVPVHTGLVAALLSFKSVKADKDTAKNKHEFDRERFFRETALRELARSREMYTMQRSYYDEISDMYYLYDDFNDRQLHLNHAIQMLSSDLAGLVEDQLQRISDAYSRKAKLVNSADDSADPQ